jgi:RNA polymerase sigma factor (sigma-70 family)
VLSREQYSHWLSVARRQARRAGEAEDLLHEAVLAAIRAGRRDLADAANAAWFFGVLRNQARMAARAAGRRKLREAETVRQARETPVEPERDELDAFLSAVVDRLPRAARAVAVLAIAGLDRREIAHILQINDAALRQRLATIRKEWSRLDPAERPSELPRLRSTLRTRLELGAIRKALLRILQSRGRFGTHDPDGHLMVLDVGSQVKGVRQQDQKRTRKGKLP